MSKRSVMMTRLFTIITITRNNLEGLKRTHKSVAPQSCEEYEWIVIDGASDDGTPEFLKSTNATFLSEPDAGIYDAMNKGIEKASGRYLIFMNAGDVFATPDILEILAEQAELKPDFIYGDALEEENGKLYYKRAKPYGKIKYGMFTHHQAMVYAREAIGDLRYDTQYQIAADYDFTWKFLQKAKRPLYIPEEPFCIFQSGGISQQKAALGRKEQFNVRKNEKIIPQALNFMLLNLQAAAWNLRRAAPAIFWAYKS